MATDTHIIINDPAGIAFAQLVARRGALRLELLGMSRHGRSAYSICKSEYGLRGNKQRVYEQVCQLVEAAQAARDGGAK